MSDDTLALEPKAGTVVIADRNNPHAWIQSDYAVEVAGDG